MRGYPGDFYPQPQAEKRRVPVVHDTAKAARVP